MSATQCLRVERISDLPRAIAHLHAIGGPAELRVPVLRALYEGRIGALDVSAKTPNKQIKQFLGMVKRPALVILGDDVDKPAGPERMPSTERLMRWARAIVIHGTGGQIKDYKAAVSAAEECGRLLFIECQSKAIAAWHDAACRWAPQTDGLILRPFAGAQHPSLEDGAK